MSGEELKPGQLPQPTEPGFDDSMGDLENEDLEKRGDKPLPVFTLKYWLSFFSLILLFVASSGLLPVESNALAVILLVLAVLGHMGYGWGKPDVSGERNFRKPSFWASFFANVMAFVLGSGIEPTEQTAQLIAMGIVVLGYMGYPVRAWIERKEMMPPESPEFLRRMMVFLLGYVDKYRR